MKTRLEKFKTKNAKGVLSLLAGNTVAQVIMVAGGLALARLYGPESSGTYNAFLSFIAILSILTTFRLENIFVISKSSKAIRNLFTTLLLVSAISTALFFLGYAIIENIFTLKTSLFIVFLSCIAGLFTAWNNVQTSLFTKYKFFKHISQGLVINAIFSVIFQAIFYYMGYKETGLIYGTIFGTVLSCAYYFSITKGRFSTIDFRLAKKTILENKEIIKYTLPSESLNAIANNLMTIMLAFYFLKEDVGFYGNASKVLVTPLILLSNSMSKVFFQKSAGMIDHRAHQLYDLSKKVILYNVGAIAVFLLLMNFIGVFILEWILGPAWKGLHIMTWILSFWILCRSALNPIQQIVVVIKKNHYAFYFNIYLVLITFLTCLIGGLNKNLLLTLSLYSFFAGIGYLIQLFFVMKELKRYKNKVDN
ncbi:oligosaccharide flippase family protein [Chishuiella sp.]|uniref:lipopolysaccharide biosynthesis protein n=1 Tax=Chishuiella sp. TaxID=1969467 RepID=UPI0028A9DA0D|nr:oligosaccharide flippase family protein [Chishuiella sp.]